MVKCTQEVLEKFEIPGRLLSIEPYGTGHINDTYRSVFEQDGSRKFYIHQRINHKIFTEPENLMENIHRVTEHLRKKILERGGDVTRETLSLVPAEDGRCFVLDGENYWRTYFFIEGAETYDLVEKPEHIYHAGRAFGDFQKLLADMPDPPLHETIPDFHNTVARFAQFEAALAADVANRAKGCQAEIEFALAHKEMASTIVDALAERRVPSRITHNDTKFNNVMIDDATGEGVCVIDLDTVMPGAVLYDFGDAVRIGAATAVEDERDLSKVGVSLELFEALARGYLDSAREFLVPAEVDLLAFSARLITFEIGLRFLTDHLAGDTYFKTHRENHNLDRCRTQFKMVAQMEEQVEELEQIVRLYC